MIISFRDKRTRVFFDGEKVKAFHSIRINDQWRICFEWPDGSPGALNVEIVDYH
jgi:proteic killer suppression protein